jgi:hypothetical protein
LSQSVANVFISTKVERPLIPNHLLSHMNKNLLLTLFVSLLAVSLSWAQTPDAINYQGVARDASGNPLVNQAIGLKLSIRSGTATGTVVYDETHSVTTNDLGLFAVLLGQGTVGTGTFSSINWGNNQYFVEVGLDASGGSSYASLGTSQLVSVAYALQAKSADDVDDADADPTNELLTGATLNGSQLELTDAGGTQTVELSSLSQSADTLWTTDDTLAYLNPNIRALGIGVDLPAFQLTVGDTGQSTIMLGHAGNFNEVESGRMIFTEDVLFDGTCGFEVQLDGAANELRIVSGCPDLIDTSLIMTRAGEVKIPEQLRIGDQENPISDLHIKQSTSGTAPSTGGIRLETTGSSNFWSVWNSTPFLSFGYNGTRVSYINNSTGAFVTTSDFRLKEDIEPIDAVLPRVMQLRPVTYHYKRNPTSDRATGFIAQEVAKVFPELVVEDPTDGLLGLSYAEFAVVSVKAIQEQQAQIDAQQAEIEALKQKVATIDALQAAVEALQAQQK